MLLVYVCISWFFGLWLASRVTAVSGEPVLPVVWLGVGGAAIVGAVLLRRRQGAMRVLACMAAVALAGARYQTAVPTIDEAHVAFYNETPSVTMTGLVSAEPDVRDRFINLHVTVDEIALPDGAVQPVRGTVLVTSFRFPEVPYGARVRLNGRLETPASDGDFDYRAYLARQDVHSVMFLPQLTVLAEGEGNRLLHAIFAFKQRAHATILQIIPEPQASLLAGILLGNDNGLSPALDEAFQITGMTHIIAISGFNVAIIITVLAALARPFLGPRGAAAFALVGVAAYTVLVGADASVVRAAMMGSVYLITSRWLGRPAFAPASLLLTGVVMTAVRPFTLWDVGFQLSFMATLGLMLYADPFIAWTRRRLQEWLTRPIVERLMGVLSEAVIITLAAQLVTLPLIAGHFQQLSLISPLANALILPAQPGVMLWGGAATLLGLAAPALGQLVGWVAWLFLAYTTTLVRALAAAPGAAVSVNVTWGSVLLMYLLLAGATWAARQERQRRAALRRQLTSNFTRRAAFGGSVIGMLLVTSWGVTQPDGDLHVAFLDVGQGDATFIQTPSGRQILVDGGLYPSVLNDELGRQLPFWDRQLDLVVATHPDADHVSGLVGVLERYRVDQLLTDGTEPGASQVYDAVLAAAAVGDVPVHHAQAGELIEIGDGVRLAVLHPGATRNLDNRNENSVALRLEYGDFSLLLTGDGEQLAEQAMLRSGRSLQALVFKAGHHGSNSSSGAALLDAVRPQIAIISAGVENRFGHPHAETLARLEAVGAVVLRTDELGTIEVISDGRSMWWQAEP